MKVNYKHQTQVHGILGKMTQKVVEKYADEVKYSKFEQPEKTVFIE